MQKNGLEIDKQNRNPSRLSRLPGIMRNGKKQYIIDTNIGKESFTEWQDWIESINDNMPEPESLSVEWDNPPELSSPLIEGVLRQGHKMLLAGPSKAGKSYALIELCAAITEGCNWLGFKCAKGKVMYVNLGLAPTHNLNYQYIGYENSWEDMQQMLRDGEIDMVTSARKTIKREKEFAFSDPIGTS